jgi:diguanylate cyclase (GGDEF)-like protein
MDALTAFLISALMIMLNGAVLGLMHGDLPESLRPSAMSWRVGTLLQAGGCVLLAVQHSLPLPIVLPLAHGMLLLGITGYWRALRQFYGMADTPLLLLPMLLGTLGIFWMAAVQPSQSGRILVAAAVWSAIVAGCIATLVSPQARDAAISRRVLTGVFVTVALAIGVSALVFVLANPLRTAIGDAGWVYLIAPMVAAVLPVVGTTAYLQLCSERIRRQWERAASTDYLTGLSNRRTLADAGERRVQQARRRGRALSVAVIDIDHFKQINDRFGHEIGDRALKHVAGHIEAACRAGDLSGRQGGEEFVTVFDGLDNEAGVAAGERIRRAVESHPFVLDGVPLTITVSLGLASLSDHDRTLDDLLRRADRALYLAKAAGRNRVALEAACADADSVLAAVS